MSPKTKKGIFIAVGVATLIIITVVVINKLKKPVDDTPQGFNKLIEKSAKDHPELLAWWESLSIENQIAIENNMTPELLAFLSKELTKKNLSEDAKKLLSKAGYKG